MPKKLTKETIAEIERLYFEEKLTGREVAARLRTRPKTVFKYLGETERQLRPAGWPEGRRQLARLGKSLPELAPTTHPALTDIAWAAGIVEGEGCVTKQKYGVGVRVSQKEPWILYRLQALFGGSIGKQKQHHSNTFSAGSVLGTWNLQGPRARGLLMTIYKWLSPHRRAQVQAAFEMSGVIKKKSLVNAQ